MSVDWRVVVACSFALGGLVELWAARRGRRAFDLRGAAILAFGAALLLQPALESCGWRIR